MTEDSFSPQIEITLDSLSDVVNVFQPSHPYWASHHPNAWIFRGHALDRWGLIPNIFRKEVCDEFGLLSIYGIRLEQFVEVEFELLHDFTLFCDSAGLQIPEQSYTYIMNPEERQFDPTDKKLYGLFPNVKLLHLMALAQHHGLPTRLLDFSYDPLTALFFAAEPPKCGTDGNNYFVVYGLNRSRVSSFCGRYKEVFAPSFSNDNLRQQKGLFLLDKKAHEDLDTGNFPTDMESILNKSFYERLNIDKGMMLSIRDDHYFYRKIMIPERLRTEVLIHLHKKYFNRAHLLPSYDNVVSTIRILPRLQPPRWRRRNEE